MKFTLKVLAKLTAYCMVVLAFFPLESIAQSSNPHNGDVYYYRRTDSKAIGCVFYAVKFMDGYIVSTSINSLEETFSQFKKDGNVHGLKSYLLQKLNNKTEKMQYSMTNSSGEPVYGDDYYHWTFTKDYSRFSSYDEEAWYFVGNPFEEYSRIEPIDIFKY